MWCEVTSGSSIAPIGCGARSSHVPALASLDVMRGHLRFQHWPHWMWWYVISAFSTAPPPIGCGAISESVCERTIFLQCERFSCVSTAQWIVCMLIVTPTQLCMCVYVYIRITRGGNCTTVLMSSRCLHRGACGLPEVCLHGATNRSMSCACLSIVRISLGCRMQSRYSRTDDDLCGLLLNKSFFPLF